MVRRNFFLLKVLFLFVLMFVVGRAGFLLYNSAAEPTTPLDFASCLLHALPQDFATATYLMLVPWAVSLLAWRYRRLPLRLVLAPYFAVVATAAAIIIVVDACMYEFWEFKLCEVVLSYASHPEGATKSVSFAFIALRVASAFVLAGLVATCAIRWTPRDLALHLPSTIFLEKHAADLILLAGLVANLTTMNAGRAYYSSRLFLNHAATNPVYAFAATWNTKSTFAAQYNLLPDKEANRVFAPLYTPLRDEGTESLLRVERPNVLVVLVESFGAKFVEELGGLPGVAPQISRLIGEGVLFEHCYANSFRTDRGTASLFNGSIAYPTASLMTMTDRHAALPSLARTFARAGYETSYLMGGPMTNMGKEQYLRDMGFATLYNDKNGFTPEELATGSWGADDSITAQHTVELIRQAKKPFFMGYQTLSSHEPFDVPYSRLKDKTLNAFAYTDECLGQLIDSLRQTPAWDNLLVVVLADHGFMYQLSYQDPEFFHIPLLLLGGALKAPRRISTLMNQSDIAATLLAQLHLPHADYPWSRNVLSPDYKHPFVYSNYPAGFLYADSTGFTIFDLLARRVVLDQMGSSADTSDEAAQRRVRRGKAILQKSYDKLD